MKLTLGQIADYIHSDGDFKDDAEAFGYSIDSRTLNAGDLFFAVTGDRVDGHDFVEAAIANGAVACVVSRHWLAPDEMDSAKLMWVPETEDCVLKAMQTLAREVRTLWGGRVIGITGSAGKTTTKEAVATVLGSRFTVLKSAGNLNNHFGMPLQLLRLEREHEVAVIEMGMNHAGEIATLCRIAEPDWGVVSNVGSAHTEFFADGVDGIARAKKELVDALPPDGIAFLNADDARVATMGVARLPSHTVMYGVGDDAQVRATDIVESGSDGVRFIMTARGESARVSLGMLGRHNVLNALAAIAVGMWSGISLPACVAAIETLRAPDKRGEIVHWRGATIVNDCYNSNPAALEAMVGALMSIPAKRHIVVAGEMLELGDQADRLHRECGAAMAAAKVDVVVGVRGHAAALVEAAGEGAIFLETPAEAGAWLAANVCEGDAVLLKASRGVRLEDALAILLK